MPGQPQKRHHAEVYTLCLQDAHNTLCKDQISENGPPPEGCQKILLGAQDKKKIEYNLDTPLKKKRTKTSSDTIEIPDPTSFSEFRKCLAQSCSGESEHYEKDASAQVSAADNNPFRRPGESDIVCVAHGNMHQGNLGNNLQCVVMSACGFAYSFVKKPLILGTEDIDEVLVCGNNIYLNDVLRGGCPRLLLPEELVVSHLGISNYNIFISVPDWLLNGPYLDEGSYVGGIARLEKSLKHIFTVHNGPNVGFLFTGRANTVSFWKDDTSGYFYLFNSHSVGPNNLRQGDDTVDKARIFKTSCEEYLARLLLINNDNLEGNEEYSIHSLKVLDFQIRENVPVNNSVQRFSDATTIKHVDCVEKSEDSDGVPQQNTRKRGRPIKKKRGRPKIKENAHLDAVIKYNKSRPDVNLKAVQKYNKANPDVHLKAVQKYNKANPEVNLKAVQKYNKANPEVNLKAVQKYNKANPEVNLKAVQKYNKANPEVNLKAVQKYNKANPDVHLEAVQRYNENNPTARAETQQLYSLSNQDVSCVTSQRYRDSHPVEVQQANREYNNNVRGIAPQLRRSVLIGQRSGNQLDQIAMFCLKNPSLNSPNIYVCPHCSAKLFEEEKSRKQWCCGQNRFNILALPVLDFDYYSDAYFLKYARAYNNLFAFTALTATHGFQHPRTGLSFIKIQGKTYHQIYDLSHTRSRNVLNYIVDDTVERQRQAENLNLRQDILVDIANAISRVNPFIDCFKRLNDEPSDEAHLVFEVTSRRTHGNILGDMPRGSEVAAIINTELEAYNPRDIVVWKIGEGRPHTIDYLHPLYESLQYPLLYPHGGSGWGLNAVDNNGSKLSQLKYYRCLLLSDSRFSELGRLSQEWEVDMYSRVEEERLRFISNMQKRNTSNALRSAPLEEVARHVVDDETVQAEGVVAGRIYLPNTYTGGARYMQTKYMDSMCMVNRLGKPSYFLTMTCNPKWPEIQQSMAASSTMASPLLCARVFNLKLAELLRDLRSGAFFGKRVYIMHVIEFQKRGLPHAHVCFKVEDGGAVQNIDIDKVIRASIPSNEEAGGRLREAVLKHMIHGPCGEGRRTDLPCWDSEKRKCIKYFPKDSNEVTFVDPKGFVHYKRDENNTAVTTFRNRPVTVSDVWVVPYNAALLLKYDCHINLEIASTRKIIKYLFKYMTKGPDEARVAVVPEQLRNDEVEQFITKRYIGACDAVWRMLEFDIVAREPTVKQIPVHLEGQHNVYFRVGRESEAVENSTSDLLIYFNRPAEPEFDDLTYQDFYEKYLVYKSRPRTNAPVYSTVDGKYYVVKRQRNEMLARLFWVPPSRGEQFYLRLLLLQFPCRGYASLLALGGSDCTTFQEAARNLGIANDNDEYNRTFEEAATFYTGYRLRRFFVLLITNGGPGLILWERFKDVICEDLLERNPNQHEEMYKRALIQIDRLLRKHGSRLTDHGLPSVQDNTTELTREMAEYTDRGHVLSAYVDDWLEKFSPGQKAVFEYVQSLLHDPQSVGYESAIFLDGPSGTGKTLLLNVIVAYVRGVRQQVAICTASSGIAAQNYTGGSTAHSVFHFPIENLHSESFWGIRNGTQRAELIRNAALIVYDEASMAHKYLIGVLDRSLRDLMQSSRPFGGKVIIFAGDFRQIPPVVPNARCHNDIVQASLKTSPLWPSLKKFSLAVAQRTRGDNEYSAFLLQLGSGQCESFTVNNNGIRKTFTVLRGVNYVTELQELIDFVFPEDVLEDSDVCTTRAILSTHNVNVREINQRIMDRVSGEYVSCYSADEVDGEVADEFYLGPDTLHSIQAAGVPDYELKLKIGCVCMIIRNLSFIDSLVNGTKVIVVNVSPRIVTVRKPRDSTNYLIPRISFKFPIEPNHPIQMTRRQFPLQVSYCLTVHKAQGQTIERVGVDLRSDCFSHGQLYVALGRVRDKDNIKILVQPERVGVEGAVLVSNVVIRELIDDNN